MRFTLLDRVDEIEPGKSIKAVKVLSLAEEYLADHFPRFPVLPGVLMLEALTQAAAWTIRLGEDFAHSMVVLRSARNVKYGDFVEPGNVLRVSAEIVGQDGSTSSVKASGTIDGRACLSARLVLARYNVADSVPGGEAIDARVIAEMKRLWRVLHPSSQASDRRGDEGLVYDSGGTAFRGPHRHAEGLSQGIPLPPKSPPSAG
ncbi:MAG: 3-hydroxyacyl-ACP dehydratase FabZ family protein [Planctomycetaceae bacterium]